MQKFDSYSLVPIIYFTPDKDFLTDLTKVIDAFLIERWKPAVTQFTADKEENPTHKTTKIINF